MQGKVERGGVPPTDIPNGALRQQVGHVAGLVHRDVSLVEVEFAGGFAMGEVIDRAAQNAVELVEAVPDGAVLGEKAEVPLADQRGLVPSQLKAGCHGGVLGWQADGFVAVTERFHEADGQAGGVPPGHQGDACWGAHGGRGVVAREAESVAGEPVDMGGAIVRPAVAAQVPVAEVVGEDEHDVWAVRSVAGVVAGGC